MKDNVVIFFTRVPIPGETKTRLMPILTGEQCRELHRAFLLDIYAVLSKPEINCDIAVYYTPADGTAEIEALCPNALSYTPQAGNNLGERMYNAICDMLRRGYKKCLLMGSDIPTIEASAIVGALDLLSTNDIVICPTDDGGYYLIGMKEPCPEVFSLEEYGVSSVLEKTAAAAKKAGKTLVTGEQLMDIDEPADLAKLVHQLECGDLTTCPETKKFIELHRSKITEKAV